MTAVDNMIEIDIMFLGLGTLTQQRKLLFDYLSFEY